MDKAEEPIMTVDRIQLQRTKGWKMPDGAKKVDRSTRWGNPFKIGSQFAMIPTEGQDLGVEGMMIVELNRDISVALHRAWLPVKIEADPDYLDGLRDARHLACWCGSVQQCHADALIEILNRADYE